MASLEGAESARSPPATGALLGVAASRRGEARPRRSRGDVSATPQGGKAVPGARRRRLVQPGQQLQGLGVRLPEDLAALDEVIEVAALNADLDRDQLHLAVRLRAYRPHPRCR